LSWVSPFKSKYQVFVDRANTRQSLIWYILSIQRSGYQRNLKRGLEILDDPARMVHSWH